MVTSEMVHVDPGQMALTTRHIYFSGERKSHRIRYDKIVAFRPHADGLGIQRDAASAKPQVFTPEDGWFACNLAAMSQ